MIELTELNIFQMRDILSKMAAKETNVDVKVSVKVWRVTGCHEFLAGLSKYCKSFCIHYYTICLFNPFLPGIL